MPSRLGAPLSRLRAALGPLRESSLKEAEIGVWSSVRSQLDGAADRSAAVSLRDCFGAAWELSAWAVKRSVQTIDAGARLARGEGRMLWWGLNPTGGVAGIGVQGGLRDLCGEQGGGRVAKVGVVAGKVLAADRSNESARMTFAAAISAVAGKGGPGGAEKWNAHGLARRGGFGIPNCGVSEGRMIMASAGVGERFGYSSATHGGEPIAAHGGEPIATLGGDPVATHEPGRPFAQMAFQDANLTHKGSKTGEFVVQQQQEVPVQAYFIGHKIDINGVASDPWFITLRKASGRDHVIFEVSKKGEHVAMVHTLPSRKHGGTYHGGDMHLIVVSPVVGNLRLLLLLLSRRVHATFSLVMKMRWKSPGARGSSKTQPSDEHMRSEAAGVVWGGA
ncbi:unnamed protein product [Ostreobium quekettii]|uniref:Uncharacterized protein n=1 Tax=Ostreobium quekettii TaxID=121088 RepID=A0A8S1J2L4_9CHLO|nr:unnamed protein product [Ostreobium quekettii]